MDSLRIPSSHVVWSSLTRFRLLSVVPGLLPQSVPRVMRWHPSGAALLLAGADELILCDRAMNPLPLTFTTYPVTYEGALRARLHSPFAAAAPASSSRSGSSAPVLATPSAKRPPPHFLLRSPPPTAPRPLPACPPPQHPPVLPRPPPPPERSPSGLPVQPLPSWPPPRAPPTESASSAQKGHKNDILWKLLGGSGGTTSGNQADCGSSFGVDGGGSTGKGTRGSGSGGSISDQGRMKRLAGTQGIAEAKAEAGTAQRGGIEGGEAADGGVADDGESLLRGPYRPAGAGGAEDNRSLASRGAGLCGISGQKKGGGARRGRQQS